MNVSSQSSATSRSFAMLLTLAVASSLRLPLADTRTFREVLVVGSEVLPWSSTSSTPINQTTMVASSGATVRLYGDRRRQVIRGEREAAVITRLPQMKTEVCRAERLEQTIREHGCLPRTIVNRYCYGQCNSFFIPRAATHSTATGRNRKHQPPAQPVSPPQPPATNADDASPTVTGSDAVQIGYGRRRPIRAGSTLKPELPFSSSISAEGAVELQWLAFKSCSFCRPKRVAWITVGLTCPRRRPAYRRRRIQIVKECSCTALTLD